MTVPLPAKEGKLDQLTSLRFFAALMIVVHHAESELGVRSIGVHWGQGVSFFFVLSGFILTYVYPRLDTLRATGRFLRARAARIWPAHAASLLLGFLIVPFAWDTPTALANLLLVHAWIPASNYYFSYNAVSWSVSTEAFFYLAFPLLVYRWQRTWLLKFVAAGVGLVAIFWIVDRLALPSYGSPPGAEGRWITQHGLVYIHPVTRLFEFILGMVVASLLGRFRQPLHSRVASALEIAAVLLCAGTLVYGVQIATQAEAVFASGAFTLWVTHTSSLFAFALLILIMAKGGGAVSRILAMPGFVLAGEISFSMYLLHQMLLTVLSRNASFLGNVPVWMQLLGFFVVLLSASYLMWVWVELPGRRLLLSRGPVHGSSTLKKGLDRHLPTGRGSALAGVLLIAVVGAFQYAVKTNPGLNPSDQATADLVTPQRYRSNVDARFEDFVRLAGAEIACDASQMHLALVWEKLGDRTGAHTTAIHFVDASGSIFGQADVALPETLSRLKVGGFWRDDVNVPLQKMDARATRVAIGVYSAGNELLYTQHPMSDWGGRRLIFDIRGCRSSGP